MHVVASLTCSSRPVAACAFVCGVRESLVALVIFWLALMESISLNYSDPDNSDQQTDKSDGASTENARPVDADSETRSLFLDLDVDVNMPVEDRDNGQAQVAPGLLAKESDSDSDVSGSSDTTQSSDDSLDIEIRRRDVELIDEINALKTSAPPKVEGEILPCDLPPVEDLHIVLPENTEMHAIGKVSQIMQDFAVVIQSYESTPALDCNSVLFFSNRKAVGKVEETFGPVPNPYYVVRFNNEEHLLSKDVELQKEVFYAPNFLEFTSYVFISTLQKMRGSDASWLNDKEPPPNLIDYSDDEQERKEKKALKNKSKNKKRERPEDKSDAGVAEQDNGRNVGRPNQWHNESRRVNVLPFPNPAFEGWNAAVSRMGAQRSCPAYPYAAPVFGQHSNMMGAPPPMPPMAMPNMFGNPPYMNHNRGSGIMGFPGPGWPCPPEQYMSNPAAFPRPPPPPP